MEVLKDFTLATDKGRWEKMKQGQCRACKEEICVFTAFD